jgi:hypothetical protein
MTYSTDIPEYIVYNDDIECIRFDIEQNNFLFQDIISKVYSDLKNDYLKVKDEFESSIENANSQEKIRLYQYYSDVLEEKSALIPQFIFKSLFLSIYGYYESILFNDYIVKILNLHKSDNWGQFQSVLNDKKIELVNPETFDFYRRIRNILVHKNGFVKNVELKSKIVMDSNLQLNDNRINIKNVQFLKDFLNYVNKFTENILLDSERKYFGKPD